jgi:succinoglycan biosynthesis protein ExoL
MKNEIRILSVLPVLGQPRHSKRISMLMDLGFKVEVVAFERDYLKGRLPNCKIKTLGKITHGQYMIRIFNLIKILPILREEIKKNDVVYAYNSDMAYICIIANWWLNKPIVIEVGDIREILASKTIKGRLMRLVDAFFIKKCKLLVATADGFVNEFYTKWLKVSIPSIILENKLESPCDEDKLIKKQVDSRITIGYFGLLRCDWSWNVLKQLAEINSDKFKIVIAGYPIKPYSLPEKSKEISNIEFLGQYKSPDDLASLYGSVDIVWACYPFPKDDEWNWKWARTNRFYESICYKKPMISLDGSGDAQVVIDKEIGILVPREEVKKVVRILNKVTKKQITHWTSNVKSLPENIYLFTTEERELKRAILEII